MPDRDELIRRLAAALVVSDARRSGDPETRRRLDHYLPSVGAPDRSAVRWRLYTDVKPPRAKAGRRRPHLISVGVLEDSAIARTSGELDAFGFTPGVGEPNGGWADRGYRERRHPV